MDELGTWKVPAASDTGCGSELIYHGRRRALQCVWGPACITFKVLFLPPWLDEQTGEWSGHSTTVATCVDSLSFSPTGAFVYGLLEQTGAMLAREAKGHDEVEVVHGSSGLIFTGLVEAGDLDAIAKGMAQ